MIALQNDPRLNIHDRAGRSEIGAPDERSNLRGALDDEDLRMEDSPFCELYMKGAIGILRKQLEEAIKIRVVGFAAV